MADHNIGLDIELMDGPEGLIIKGVLIQGNDTHLDNKELVYCFCKAMVDIIDMDRLDDEINKALNPG